MKILMAHNYYQHRGGEDISFTHDAALLEAHGHRVIRVTRDNRDISAGGLRSNARLSATTVWSQEAYRELKRLLQDERPQVAHFQNTFPLLSPSVYYACRAMGVPVVQNLRNYRLMCANVLFRRDGRVCEDCLGKPVPWPAVVHACYRHSRSSSAVVASMLAVHRALGSWHRKVNVYVALTEFGRRKFIEGGLPAEKIVVRPNFVIPDPGPSMERGDFVLFVGRLSEEKGVNLLLEAWSHLDHIPLKMVGSGPLGLELEREIGRRGLRHVQLVGEMEHPDVMEAIKTCRFVVIPSLWYEGFSRVLVETFACGKVALAPDLGTFAELVDDRRTGVLFSPASGRDLAAQVEWAWSHPHEMTRIGLGARKDFEANYTAERNYEMLMDIYRRATQGSPA